MSDPPGDQTAPLDEVDPRFVGLDAPAPGGKRTLVRSKGPGASLEDPKVRILRWAFPAVALAGATAVAAVFFLGLDPGSGRQVLGPEQAVRAAVDDRPRRVCYHDNFPCAWLTVVDGRLLALDTNGPLPQEYGRQGVSWCSSSDHFGANSTGSRFDQAGQVVGGPAFRGLDRFGIIIDPAGTVSVNFRDVTAGAHEAMPVETHPPTGPHCGDIPFDRDPDLDIDPPR